MPRVSKIAKLPPPLREWLHKAFVKRAFGDIEAVTAELNELMRKSGIADSIGKSAVGAESQRVRRAQESIAATTRAMQLIADTADDPADKRGEALNAMLSEGIFDVMLDIRSAESEPDPAKRIALLNKAALAAARLTTTSVRQRQWRAQVDKQVAAAAKAVTRIARDGGMSPETQRAIREQVLGITQRAISSQPQA